ncbi:MAG: CopG family transcriptional regulator [Nitrospirae bacterium]|nr:CopG family transcriptional regulator [Nitrospirota bacterium]
MARPKRDNVEREIFSVRVDSELARQYRHRAIDMRVSLSELIERALRQYITAPIQTDNIDKSVSHMDNT